MYVFPEKISRMVMPFTESVRSHLEAEQNYLLRTAFFSLWSSGCLQVMRQKKRSMVTSRKSPEMTWSLQVFRVLLTLWHVQDAHFRTTFVCGQEEILQLHALMRFLRKSAVTHREHFLLWWIFSGRAITLKQSIRMKREEFWMKSCMEWRK